MNESKTTSKPEVTDADASAESILNLTPLARRLAPEARQEIDAVLRRQPGPSVMQIWKDLRMKERFNVGQHMFRDYAQMFRAVDASAISRRVAQDIAELLLTPTARSQQLQQGNDVLLHRELARQLHHEQLKPLELAALLSARARHVSAQARLMAQQLAQEKYRLQEQQAKATLQQQATQKDPFTDPEELRRRVRLIYGWDMPDDYGHENDPAPSGANSLTDPSQASARLKRTLEAVGICGNPRTDPNPPSDATQRAADGAAITPPPEAPESAVVPASPRPDVSASVVSVPAPAVPCNLSPVTCNLPLPAVPCNLSPVTCNLPLPTQGARAGEPAAQTPSPAQEEATLSDAPRVKSVFDRAVPSEDPWGPSGRERKWKQGWPSLRRKWEGY